jgi:branched-chain amino acid transport system ATP-binding protein
LAAEPIIAMRNIEAGYHATDLVLDDVSIEAAPDQVTAILGPNGSGKSTSLKVLAGLLTPRRGSVLFLGEDITSMPAHRRREAGIATLPQGRSTFPDLTVEENLALGGWTQRDKRELDVALDRTYERYPLLAERRLRPAGSLSGGQQRILEVARMMVCEPAVLLIDEPSVGLAPKLVEQVYDEIRRFKEEDRTIVLVDQNIGAAVDLADHVYTLTFGRNHLDGDHGDFEGRLAGLVREWLQF